MFAWREESDFPCSNLLTTPRDKTSVPLHCKRLSLAPSGNRSLTCVELKKITDAEDMKKKQGNEYQNPRDGRRRSVSIYTECIF